jgi:4-hydroxy-2-oxoheptanedioate aldolase
MKGCDMNQIKDILKKEVQFGIFMTSIKWPGIIQILAKNQFNFVVIDTEHGSYSYEEVQLLSSTAKLYGIHPIVRVAEKQYHLVSRALDMGAGSIMMPCVETGKDVEDIIRWSKYPPEGKRGAGSYSILLETEIRQHLLEANQLGLVVIQIETRKGMENLDDILRYPDIDVVFIGPLDLSIDLGVPGDFQNPVLHHAIGEIAMKCQAAGKTVGILCNPEQAKFFVQTGITFLAIGTDVHFFLGAAMGAMSKAR